MCCFALTIIPVPLRSELTKCQLALVVGHSMQQGDGATGINCCLLQEINLRAICNLVGLLLPERLMLQDRQITYGHVWQTGVWSWSSAHANPG